MNTTTVNPAPGATWPSPLATVMPRTRGMPWPARYAGTPAGPGRLPCHAPRRTAHLQRKRDQHRKSGSRSRRLLILFADADLRCAAAASPVDHWHEAVAADAGRVRPEAEPCGRRLELDLRREGKSADGHDAVLGVPEGGACMRAVVEQATGRLVASAAQHQCAQAHCLAPCRWPHRWIPRRPLPWQWPSACWCSRTAWRGCRFWPSPTSLQHDGRQGSYNACVGCVLRCSSELSNLGHSRLSPSGFARLASDSPSTPNSPRMKLPR